MIIDKELQDIRNALRPATQRKAQAIMQEIEQERQKAAARGDKEEVFYLAEQVKNIAESSIIADNIAIDNAVISWDKRKAERQAEADKVKATIQPPSDPVARLNEARRLAALKDKKK